MAKRKRELSAEVARIPVYVSRRNSRDARTGQFLSAKKTRRAKRS